jgi:polyisoprenoid-binding protein YceI
MTHLFNPILGAIFAVLSVFHLLPMATAQEHCRYSESKTIAPAHTLQWTAYKFTEKAAVKGTFEDIQYKVPQNAATIPALLKESSFSIKTSSVQSGNEGRDANLKANFFRVMGGKGAIHGRAIKVEGDNQSGNIIMQLTMGGHSRQITLAYQVTAKKELIISGTLDLLAHGLERALESIHRACYELHTGKDGIAKTWHTVDLEAKLQLQCE